MRLCAECKYLGCNEDGRFICIKYSFELQHEGESACDDFELYKESEE